MLKNIVQILFEKVEFLAKKIRNRFKDILSENIEDIITNYSSKVDELSKNLQLSKR